MRGDFVVEYKGDLLDAASAKKCETKYSENPDFGCYMYYFNFKDKRYWLDTILCLAIVYFTSSYHNFL